MKQTITVRDVMYKGRHGKWLCGHLEMTIDLANLAMVLGHRAAYNKTRRTRRGDIVVKFFEARP